MKNYSNSKILLRKFKRLTFTSQLLNFHIEVVYTAIRVVHLHFPIINYSISSDNFSNWAVSGAGIKRRERAARTHIDKEIVSQGSNRIMWMRQNWKCCRIFMCECNKALCAEIYQASGEWSENLCSDTMGPFVEKRQHCNPRKRLNISDGRSKFYLFVMFERYNISPGAYHFCIYLNNNMLCVFNIWIIHHLPTPKFNLIQLLCWWVCYVKKRSLGSGNTEYDHDR